MSASLPTSVGVFDTVFEVIETELRSLRSEGLPFKSGFERVARRMRITARRVRQYHERQVAEDAVTAKEWLAALEIQNSRRRARIEEAMALLAQEGRA